jgi:hypothetical protein
MGLATRIQQSRQAKTEIEVWTGRTQQEQWVVENLSQRGPVDISTPVALVNEMLDQLWKHIKITPEMKFLDPACGRGTFLRQLLIRLIQEPCLVTKFPSLSDREAYIRQSMLYGFEIDAAFVHVLQRQGYVNVTLQNALEYKVGMKFDVVIGNPPYQDSSAKSSKLWIDFTLKILTELDPAFVGFVTPASWRSTATKRAMAVQSLLRHNVLFVKDATKLFRVGETIAAWIYAKTASSFLPEEEVIPKSTIDYIFEKVRKPKEAPRWHYKDFSTSASLGVHCFDTPQGVHTTPVFWTSVRTVYADSARIHQGWKVILNNSGYYPSHPGDNRYMKVSATMGVGENGIGIRASSEAAAHNVASWAASKLYYCLVTQLKSGGFNQSVVVQLPYLGEEKLWTDEQIYEHFKLTPEEIAYIESTVK